MNEIKRYALVRGLHADTKTVAAYLPSNYKVIGTFRDEWACGRFDDCVVIEGRDNHGWTLDGYVIPRLGSGLMRADEIDLSHPAMKGIDEWPPLLTPLEDRPIREQRKQADLHERLKNEGVVK